MTTTEQTSTELEVASAELTHAPGDREMTMLEHLEELRQRLVVATVSVVVGLLVTLIPLPGLQSLTAFVVQLLATSAPGGVLYGLKPGEAFFTYLQVSLVLGVALAMPVLVFQILAFVSPALYAKEKRYLWIAAPALRVEGARWASGPPPIRFQHPGTATVTFVDRSEVHDPGVLQELPENRTHRDVLREALDAGAQRADAAHHHLDAHSGL